MPTGYTSDIYEGKSVSLTDFVTNCAQAFGAFFHMRNSDNRELSYPAPPDDSYYSKSLAAAKADLVRWQGLTEEQKYAAWSEYFNEATVCLHENVAKNAELRARYESMLAQVQAIDVPSPLQSLKNFMVEQLTDAIKFDCGPADKFEDYFYEPADYSRWCDDAVDKIQWDVVYYEKSLREEQERYDTQVAYIDLVKDTYGLQVKENTHNESE